MKNLLVYSKDESKFAKNFIDDVLRSGFNKSSPSSFDIHRSDLITNNDSGCLKSGSNEWDREAMFTIKRSPIANGGNNNSIRKSINLSNADNESRTYTLLFLSHRGIKAYANYVALLKNFVHNISVPTGFIRSHAAYSSSSKGMICLCSSSSWLKSYFGSFLRFGFESMTSFPLSNVYSTLSPAFAFSRSSSVFAMRVLP